MHALLRVDVAGHTSTVAGSAGLASVTAAGTAPAVTLPASNQKEDL